MKERAGGEPSKGWQLRIVWSLLALVSSACVFLAFALINLSRDTDSARLAALESSVTILQAEVSALKIAVAKTDVNVEHTRRELERTGASVDRALGEIRGRR